MTNMFHSKSGYVIHVTYIIHAKKGRGDPSPRRSRTGPLSLSIKDRLSCDLPRSE